MVGRAVPASRPPHRRKLRFQNSRYTSFGGIISGGGKPTKILGKVFPAGKMPAKIFGNVFPDEKSPTKNLEGPLFGAETPSDF